MRTLLIATFTVCLLSASFADPDSAQQLQKAVVDVQADIRNDTEMLNQLRDRIETERIPLAREMERLRKQVLERRSEVDRIRRLQTQGAKQQAALQSKAESMEEEATYLRSLFSEYARAMDTRMNVARNPETLSALIRLRRILDQDRSDFSDSVASLLELSLNWNRERVGGMRFTGSALDEKGLEHEGDFATFGPAAYFASTEGGPVGLAHLQFGIDRPGVYTDLSKADLEAIRALASGREAVVPVDASGGDAIRLADAKPGFIQHLRAGGFTMIPLAGVALAALILSIWKWMELSRMQIQPGPHVQSALDALRKQDVAEAGSYAAQVGRPLRQLVDDLIAYHDAPREHLEEIMQEHILSSLPYVERNLGALAVLGGVAPLLGLLGTVTGMIHTFQLVTLFGSGDAKLLSGGISEALVTTEVGLAIAIPTLLFHAYLSRRAKGIMASMETASVSLVNDLKLRAEAP